MKQILITQNSSISQSVRYGAVREKAVQGASSWESVTCWTLAQFVSDQWLSLWPNQKLMHTLHLLACYMAEIEKDEVGKSRISVASLARKCVSTDRLSSHYRISVTQAAFDRSINTQTFARWHQAVQERIQRKQWIKPESLYETLIEAFDSGAWKFDA